MRIKKKYGLHEYMDTHLFNKLNNSSEIVSLILHADLDLQTNMTVLNYALEELKLVIMRSVEESGNTHK